MNELEELGKIESEITAGFRKLDNDFNFISFGRYERLIVKLLEESMDDTDGWISWWIYEAEFGNNTSIADSVTLKDDTPFRVRTTHKLYDLLTIE